MQRIKSALLAALPGILLGSGVAMETRLFAGAQADFPMTLKESTPLPWGGAGCSLVREKDAYVITLGGDDTWPGVAFNPPNSGFWDFSPKTMLLAEIENLDPAGQCEIHGRIYTISADGKEKFSVFNSVVLNPGETRTLKVPFGRILADTQVELPKLKAVPDGVKGVPNIYPERVTSISFYARAPFMYGRNGSVKFRLSGIRLSGEFKGVAAPVTEPGKFFPFIDRYGQYIHGSWPEKIREDADLTRRRAEEAAELARLPEIAARNLYGGWENGPSLKATGFFRVEKYQGKWWLVDPTGKLFISHGMNGVHFNGVGDTRNRETWFTDRLPTPGEINFARRNLEIKHGAPLNRQIREIAAERLKKWGVNTVGSWSDADLCQLRRMPYTVMLNDWSPVARLGTTATYAKFYDAFDPAFARNLDELFKKHQWTINDPWCLGYFINNELQFSGTTTFADYTLTRPADFPAKQAFQAHLEKQYRDIAALNRAWKTDYADWNAFLAATTPPKVEGEAERDLTTFHDLLIEEYYRVCRDAVRRNAPNQLYLGSRFRGTTDLRKPNLAAIAARYCDVMSVNNYAGSLAHMSVPGGLPDVPILIGEYSLLVLDRGLFNSTMIPAGADQRDRAAGFLRLWQGLLSHPNLVGAHWFYYRDQFLTGRNDGENYPLGFVDICDTPYPEMTAMSRRINEHMYSCKWNGKLPETFIKEP